MTRSLRGWIPLLALALFQGCPAPDGSAPAVLNAYLSTEPPALNFLSQNDRSTRTVSRLVCDTLVDYNPAIELVPRLAESWEASADGREVTFHLRAGVTWHDGEPFTAADVAFTLEKLLDPETLATGRRVYFEGVESYAALDDRTFRVTRSEPYARAVDVWQLVPIYPRHAFPDDEDFLESERHRAPLGTGPYRFHDWIPGSAIELAASPDYWGGRPPIPRIRLRPMPEPATRVEALLAGQLDLTTLRPEDRRRIEGNPDLARRVRLLPQASLYVWYIAWNLDGSNPFFGDRRVRRAMAHASDRAGFVEHVLMGDGRVATSLIHPAIWSFDPDIEPWPYDRDTAARLLDEAGWTDTDQDGVRDRDGAPFRFELMLPAGNQEIQRFAALLQESLRTLGVDMSIRRLEYNVFSRRRNAGEFTAFLNGWSLDPDPDCYDFWHSSQQRGHGINYANYADPEVDALCDDARKRTSREERAEIYRRVQGILHRDQPNLFIAYRNSLLGVSQRLKGVETSPLGVWGTFPGPLRWSIAPSE